MAREFYLKNPTPPGAAQATSLGSIGNTRNPTPPTHKEGQGESTEASKEYGSVFYLKNPTPPGAAHAT